MEEGDASWNLRSAKKRMKLLALVLIPAQPSLDGRKLIGK
jgi:hypothetical protein